MFYYEEDFTIYFNRIVPVQGKEDLMRFKCKSLYIHEFNKILNTYLWSHKISNIKYKFKGDNIIAIIQLSEIAKFTYIEIFTFPYEDISEFKEAIESVRQWRFENGTVIEIIYKLFEGKLQYHSESKFLLAFMHSIQYDFPYYDVFRPSYSKYKSDEKRLKDYLRDEGIDFF